MKNFYDLTVIDGFDVNIHLGVESRNKNFELSIHLNDRNVYSDNSHTDVYVTEKININDNLKLNIKLSDIDYSIGHPSIKIKKISVDDIELIPRFTHLSYYNNDKNITSPTSIIEFNGEWILDTKQPIKWWIHEHTGKGWLLKP